ncbi:hypothetical protein AAF712_013403 [Marasmius tenuissimus]|uniref:Uncharacterized protein n=1 Tax=Marasmius tenuissimus TaxID=585030 RepID=A0ABR2ZEQ9_9AGAR
MTLAAITPVKITPIKITPVTFTPVTFTPVKVTPVKVTPVKVTPVEITPVKITQVKITQVKITPVSLSSSTQSPSDDTHKTNIGVIVGVISTSVLALVVATFCLIRWKKRRKVLVPELAYDNSPKSSGRPNDASIARPLSPFMTQSHTLTSTRPKISTKTGALLDSSVTRSTPPPPRKPHQILSRLERENSNQPSHTESVSAFSEESVPVNTAEISAMRAEMRAMRTRMAVLEAVADDQPPDYVSSYSSTSRSTG